MQRSLLEYIQTRNPWIVVEDRIRRFVRDYNARFVYVLFSGGKDSAAVLAAANSAVHDRMIVVYLHIVGNTHVDNVMAARSVAKRLGIDVVTIVARKETLTNDVRRIIDEHGAPLMLHVIVRTYREGLDFWSAIEHYGMPVPLERSHRGVRWCSSEFKEKWIKQLPRFNGRLLLISGVKASDSWHRSRTSRLVRRDGSVVTLQPLVDMSDADVWSMLYHYGIADIVRKQYDVWGHAPNCMICPFMSIEKMKKSVRRMPTRLLQRILSSINKAKKKCKSVSCELAEKMEMVIRAELERRGVTH